MPWCETCARYWTPTSVSRAGECPTCGHRFAPDASVDAEELADDYKAPWHFKLMVALAVVYVTWRIIQMVSWLA